MVTRVKRSQWERFARLRRQRRAQNLATFAVVVMGPVLALATFLVLGPLDQNASSIALRAILLADLVYVLMVAALVLQQVARMIALRRRHSSGSRLHMRLTGVFALMALVPTVTVAIFAGLTINMGLEGWFSDRVSRMIGNSVSAAHAYENEHIGDLQTDSQAIAGFLNSSRESSGRVFTAGDFRALLVQVQPQIQRGLREAFIVDGSGDMRARGERSYLFDFEAPTPAQIAQAQEEGFVIIRDLEQNELRALVHLDAFVDRFLYVSRNVDGEIFSLLDDTRETAQLYAQLEDERGRVLFEFSLVYIGFALILILASVFMGLWFAERLSRPVGRLAGAAKRVGAGDLDVQVIEEEGDDEIAMLGRYFNQMTRQLKGQRKTLLDNTHQIEERQRLFDSVLSSVTSGVIGLDREGRVTFANPSASRLLFWDADHRALLLSEAIPEFTPLFEELVAQSNEVAQQEIKVSRAGRMEHLLVRFSTRRNEAGDLEGYVLAFDDVTDLVAAQRTAAWGDVARRIAHEIKNPLTPIQLSAERIKRKFSPRVGEESDALEGMTDVIVRQTNDLRRIVDEFSKFARMPEPERRLNDLAQVVRDAVLLQEAGQPDVAFKCDVPKQTIAANVDETMVSQALINLIKNAGEAIETYQSKGVLEDPFVPEIRVAVDLVDDNCRITISDNGIGLPEDRTRLFEPYVTTRDKGTGLGLAIVKKIIEEHNGSLILLDAETFEGNTRFGAMAEVVLPVITAEDSRIFENKQGGTKI